MIFSSYAYFLFFVVVFTLYWAMRRHHKAQNVMLLVSSLFFYAYWDYRLLSLLLGCIAVAWIGGILIGRKRHARAVMWSVVAINLAVLGIFKYLGFFRDNAVALLKAVGLNPDWPTVDILLPVGISFFTFQAIAYVVDVWKGRVAPERNPITFALFISFFPQLVAGPIERSSSLLPQLRRQRRWDYPHAVEGMKIALWGLVKKIVVADACAHYVDSCFTMDASPARCVAGAVLFSVQIYCDFSGYCDIAVGSARLLGIELMQNFRYPYFAESVQQFWRRWNVSLMMWFRDYVYIPLGGSRVSSRRTVVNLLVVFLLSGLWHGAGWCFIIWGAYWGLCSVLTRGRNIGIAAVCALAVVSWTIFRADSLTMLGHVIPPVVMAAIGVWLGVKLLGTLCRWLHISRRMAWTALLVVVLLALCGAFACYGMMVAVAVIHFIVIVAIVGVMWAEWRGRHSYCALSRLPRNPLLRRLILALLVAIVLTNHAEDMAFIYFQF